MASFRTSAPVSFKRLLGGMPCLPGLVSETDGEPPHVEADLSLMVGGVWFTGTERRRVSMRSVRVRGLSAVVGMWYRNGPEHTGDHDHAKPDEPDCPARTKTASRHPLHVAEHNTHLSLLARALADSDECISLEERLLEDNPRAVRTRDAECRWSASCQNSFWSNALCVPRVTGRSA